MCTGREMQMVWKQKRLVKKNCLNRQMVYLQDLFRECERIEVNLVAVNSKSS